MVCRSKLLQSWLRGFEGNALDLLYSLDVENSTEVCQQMLQHLFNDTSIADLITHFSLLDDESVSLCYTCSYIDVLGWG